MRLDVTSASKNKTISDTKNKVPYNGASFFFCRHFLINVLHYFVLHVLHILRIIYIDK